MKTPTDRQANWEPIRKVSDDLWQVILSVRREETMLDAATGHYCVEQYKNIYQWLTEKNKPLSCNSPHERL